MKNSLKALFAGAVAATSLFSAQIVLAQAAPANTDCYMSVSQLQLVHGCIYTEGSGPGWCESWQSGAPNLYAPMTRTSLNHYEFNNAQYGVNVNVVFNGKDKAQISIRAPHVNQTTIEGVSFENYDTSKQFPESAAQARFRDRRHQIAFNYDVRCSFGLSDGVDAIDAAELAEMNALGPAPEWSDASAPSVQNLPIGTILELTKDMDINPGSDTGLTRFVEQNGLMTDVGFGQLHLPYRFAFADIFNANNGYMYVTHYPKGMRLQVTKVEMEELDGGAAHQFELTLKLIGLPAGYAAPIDSIVRMEVTGRRSGAADIKIPQLAALLTPAMKMILPK